MKLAGSRLYGGWDRGVIAEEEGLLVVDSYMQDIL